MSTVEFSKWTKDREIGSLGTNAGATPLAFQEWCHFKEAFPPEIVAMAIDKHRGKVSSIVDPFGGSGTTTLACQFLGIAPHTIEVNPYLADLIEAKVTTYNVDDLARDLGRVTSSASRTDIDLSNVLPDYAPKTLIEPGVDGRWIFDKVVAERVFSILSAIQRIETPSHRRLFRVLLGGILIGVSNVIVNGKGRRYRRNWKSQQTAPSLVLRRFHESVGRALNDINRFANRAYLGYSVQLGDVRDDSMVIPSFDIAVFSPPYPNSFDYTDVYNVELWTLGYLNNQLANRHLRESTLCSHVQIKRNYPDAPHGSSLLNETMKKLFDAKDKLWSPWITNMVGGYFHDLLLVLGKLKLAMHSNSRIWLVVGDSRYVGVHIPTPYIIAELAQAIGLRVVSIDPFRSMRTSPQQGGAHHLSESTVILEPVAGHDSFVPVSQVPNSRTETNVEVRFQV